MYVHITSCVVKLLNCLNKCLVSKSTSENRKFVFDDDKEIVSPKIILYVQYKFFPLNSF